VTYTPDLSSPIYSTEKALALLQQTPITEDALAEARRYLAGAAEAVPYLGEARHCAEYRRRTGERLCGNPLCGRCNEVKAAGR